MYQHKGQRAFCGGRQTILNLRKKGKPIGGITQTSGVLINIHRMGEPRRTADDKSL